MRILVLLLASTFFWINTGLADPGDIRVLSYDDSTRIIIETDRAVSADVFQSIQGDDRQITVGLSQLQDFAATAKIMPGSGIQTVQSGENRVVFTLNRPLHVKQFKETPPAGDVLAHRVIIDLIEVSAIRFDRTAKRDAKRLQSWLDRPLPEDVPIEAPQAETVLASRNRWTIVIDAGHGGKDPGTTVSPLIDEKDVVLKTALVLRDRLSKNPNFRVRLVRDDDTYVDHEDRVSMARDWGADLFISLHADSVGRSSVRGAAVFTLDQKGQSRIKNTSRANDWHIDLETDVPVAQPVLGILDRLTIRETLNASQKFTQILIPELKKTGPVHASGHRKSNLFVLLAPDMPAVLVELGFLSNNSDAERLASTTGRRNAAIAIERAITKYFAAEPTQFVKN